MTTQTKTVEQVLAEVAAARELANRNFERQFGHGSLARLQERNKRENPKALEDICRACERAGI